MMTSQEIQLMILRELRHGPLNYFRVAEQIDQAPFRVRAELRCLKSERYVTEHLEPTEVLWHLTTRGEQLAWKLAQAAMFR